ncbi:hypothetical protein BsWGS_12301 [Bradybaena similaris]
MNTHNQGARELGASSSEESISLLPEDITGDNIMSMSSDPGYTSQDSCSETFRQVTQLMSQEQNLSSDDSSVHADIYTDMADNVGTYNLDVILCQFDSFFRSRLNSELEAFQETMHSMLTEQQIHIQRIVCSIVEQNLNEECSEAQEEVPVESNGNITEASEIRCTCHNSESKTKMDLIIELLSLSCQITSLLNLPKFVS